MSIIKELKRRNVFKVGIAYTVVAWLVAQVLQLVFESFGTPVWAIKTVLVLLATGLPFALFFAWAFEMTPEGLKREQDVDRSQSIAPQTGRKLDRWIMGILALAVVFLVYDRLGRSTDPADIQVATQTEETTLPASVPAKSIAVLPFSNLSSDPDTDSFVSGLHDDLLTQLSKVHDLKVISRTSVLRYAATIQSMKEIAAELGVATIMEGGIQRAGDRVRINVQLIDSNTDEHLWAETYDRVLTTENVFDIQSEITRQITVALEAALTPAEEARLAERPTISMPAYEAFLKAKLLEERYQSLGEAVLDEAIEMARLSVELDPDFSEAWSALAHVLLSRFWYEGRDQQDANAARAALERARTLKPDSPDVGLMLGLYHYWVNYEYAAALSELDQVLLVEPGNEKAWAVRGWALRRSGRWDEALDSMQRAAMLNPNSVENLSEVADTLMVLDRFEDTSAWLQKVHARVPDSNTIGQVSAQLILLTTGNSEPTLKVLRDTVLQETLNPTEQFSYVMAEANYADPQKALDYLDQWAPGIVDVQYKFWPEALIRAFILNVMGRTVEAQSSAAEALPVIEAAMRFEPNQPDIKKAQALALALLGQGEAAEKAVRRVRELYPRSLDDWGGADYLFEATRILAIAGRDQLAFEWLDDYLSGNGAVFTLIAIRELPAFSRLAGEPEFSALIEKYGLVPEDKSLPK
ncbi:MAG: tetratricopeptide repeat protein [Xanthomonadales bacterium]|nr:tetratricopeptide repeat protein [Xanthomonadales bacterium]